MTFFSSKQLFGNGSGSPGGSGWVPIDLSAPPTYSPNNRGIAFGEQLTSAIANRPHYALALNDDDLNTRLTSFEVGGLNAAYDLGTIGPHGGGRIITKDGGAVETQSALSSQYADDIMNAHFRANMTGDAVAGGVGFDAVSYGRAPGAQIGFVDRRALNINNFSILTDTMSATLNVGNLNPSGITLSGGAQWADSSGNTDLLSGVELVEILSGAFKGVYYINVISSQFLALVGDMDGLTGPSFTANTSVTVRVYRMLFTSQQNNVTMWGLPGTTASLNLAGNALGRFDTLGSSKDGPRYALRHIWKDNAGNFRTMMHIDGHGQVASTVSTAQMTTAQRAAGVQFGAPAFVSQQDGTGGDYEVGYLSRSNDAGALGTWMSFLSAGQANPPTTPSGIFAFTFINIAPYNVTLTDTTTADFMVNQTMQFIEIISPSPQAGIYRVDQRDANNGRLKLVTLEGATVTLPTSGSGTMRLFVTQSFGARDLNLLNSILVGSQVTVRAGAVFQSPRELGGTALVLEAANRNADPVNYWFIRGIVSDDGGTTEMFAVSAHGELGARTIQTTLDYTYRNVKTYRQSFVGGDAKYVSSTFMNNGPVFNTADPETFFLVGQGDLVVKSTDETTGTFAAQWTAHLPQGAIVTAIGARYTTTAGSGPVADSLRFTLCSKQIGSGVLSMKTGSPSYFTLTPDSTTRNDSFTLTETSGNRTVDNEIHNAGRAWFLWFGRPTGSGDYGVIIHTVWIEYTLTTVAGA